MSNKNKSLIVILIVLTIGLVGVTIAYFSNSTSIDNTFKTGKYEHRIEETFISPSDWLPGETIPKLITVTNDGSVDIIEWECSIVDIVDSGGWWLVYILVSIVPIDIIDSLISVDILDSKRSLDFIVSLFRLVDIVDLWISTTIVDSL